MKIKQHVNFDENKIVDAILLLCHITYEGDEKHTEEEVIKMAMSLYIQVVKSLMQVFQYDNKSPGLIHELMLKSGMKSIIEGPKVH